MFRIDKSMVGQTHEPFVILTPPVLHVDPESPEEKVPSPDAGNPPLSSAKLVDEAHIECERLLNEARIECDEIIKAAQDQAQTILSYAEESARILKEKSENEGYNRGYGKGAETARREAERRTAEETLAFETLRSKIAAQQERLIEELKNQVLDLSVTIAEKITNTVLSDSGEAFMDFVEGALGYVKAEKEITVRINAGEYNKYFADGMKPRDDELKVIAVPDEDIPPGSCFVETNSEVVNAGVGKQLEAIKIALLQSLPHDEDYEND